MSTILSRPQCVDDRKSSGDKTNMGYPRQTELVPHPQPTAPQQTVENPLGPPPHNNALHWRHNERDGVSNQQPHDCLLNRLFMRRSKKTSMLRVTGLCEGKFTGDRWIPRTKGQWHGKCFHLMTSSWKWDSIILGFQRYDCSTDLAICIETVWLSVKHDFGEWDDSLMIFTSENHWRIA